MQLERDESYVKVRCPECDASWWQKALTQFAIEKRGVETIFCECGIPLLSPIREVDKPTKPLKEE